VIARTMRCMGLTPLCNGIRLSTGTISSCSLRLCEVVHIHHDGMGGFDDDGDLIVVAVDEPVEGHLGLITKQDKRGLRRLTRQQ